MARKPTVVERAPRADAPPLAGPVSAPAISVPLTLEPIPAGAEDEKAEPPRSRPAPASGGSRRYPGAVLGRILGTDEESNAKSAIRVESKPDPAVEAAVKRRVEKTIRETLGDRVKSVEVRVTGRTVVIRAHASRFWYRRSVRRALDSLSLPSGYRGRIERVD